jgi:hypothetical protein
MSLQVALGWEAHTTVLAWVGLQSCVYKRVVLEVVPSRKLPMTQLTFIRSVLSIVAVGMDIQKPKKFVFLVTDFTFVQLLCVMITWMQLEWTKVYVCSLTEITFVQFLVTMNICGMWFHSTPCCELSVANFTFVTFINRKVNVRRLMDIEEWLVFITVICRNNFLTMCYVTGPEKQSGQVRWTLYLNTTPWKVEENFNLDFFIHLTSYFQLHRL